MEKEMEDTMSGLGLREGQGGGGRSLVITPISHNRP